MSCNPIHDSITSTVAAEPGILLAELLDRVEGCTNAHVFQLIVLGKVYVDLRSEWLGEPGRVHLFRDRETAKFFQCFSEVQVGTGEEKPKAENLIPNSTLLLDGILLEVMLVGKTEITFHHRQGNRCPVFPLSDFQKWMDEGRVIKFATRQVIDRNSEAYKVAQSLQHRDQLFEALQRYNEIVRPRLEGRPITDTSFTDRHVRNLVKRFKFAEAMWGNGLLGLAPNHHRKGNSTDRLVLIHPELRQKMIDFIDKEYETVTYPTVTIAYGEFRNRCNAEGIKPPSYKTFSAAIAARAGAKQTEKMEGRKAAYQEEEFIDWEEGIPIYGDKPWEYAHIDHTLVDVVLRHTDKGVVMGKAWLTLLIDSYSRDVLAYYLSYESPSHISCLGVVRECVRRHGRLPECFIADNGKEFQGAYFETLIARYKCDIIWRPPTKPRFGAVIERFIHTLNTQFIHRLTGNTKIMKKVRQVTKEVDPFKRALWNLPMLDEAMERYFYEEYPNYVHAKLGQKPRDAFNEGIVRFPPPERQQVNYDDNLIINTMPSTKKGTARLLRSRGLLVFGEYYRSKKLRRSELYGKQLEVRYDPWNRAHVYAWDGKEWILCLAAPRVYSWLRGRSEREIRIMAEEYRQLYRLHGKGFNVKAEELARNHQLRMGSERQEKQRLKDEEMRLTAARRGRHLSPMRDSGLAHAGPKENIGSEAKAAGSVNIRTLPTFKRAKRGRGF